MFTVQHLQQQRAELQGEYDSLSSIIRKLRDSHAVENDPALLSKLEYQIQEYEERREKIVPKIEDLETKINTLDQTAHLYRALLRLNFRNQDALFHRLVNNKSQVGAFLIYGEPDYGQSWLLNRLINQVPYNIGGKIIPISLKPLAGRWGLDALHRVFKGQQSLTGTLSLGDVVDQVHRWWQTQTVILIFHHINILKTDMREFIQSFWVPLVDKALNAPCSSPYYRLLAFLVDNDGDIDVWPFDVAEQLDDSWKPHIPVKPPKLAPILNDELINWMTNEGNRLPFNLQVEDILRRSKDGIPQYVLEEICDLCDCNWFEKENLWIKY